MPDFNGRVYFDKHFKPAVNDLFLDASLSGEGGIWEGSVYAIPLGFIQGLPLNCTIVHLEMINVFIALNLWKHKLQGRTIVIHCNNMAVVNSISSGRSWDSFFGSVARNIWHLTATHDIELTVLHIPSKKKHLCRCAIVVVWGRDIKRNGEQNASSILVSSKSRNMHFKSDYLASLTCIITNLIIR